jgi:GDP-L-fucose synthase
MPEDSLLTGPLEPTNQWYAVAKIAGHKLCEALHSQHSDDMLTLMPTNLYGPGDDFDLETTHVLPALLRKAHEAKSRKHSGPDGSDAPVTLWSSSTPKREFLYVEDLADAVRFALETPEAEIREVVDHDGPVEHDRSKPDGIPRKLVDTSRMDALGWTAQTSLRDGIEKTYNWYREHEEEPIEA